MGASVKEASSMVVLGEQEKCCKKVVALGWFPVPSAAQRAPGRRIRQDCSGRPVGHGGSKPEARKTSQGCVACWLAGGNAGWLLQGGE